ncbi:hypothetical protein STEG23_034343, partial [Scotinomys teguina]
VWILRSWDQAVPHVFKRSSDSGLPTVFPKKGAECEKLSEESDADDAKGRENSKEQKAFRVSHTTRKRKVKNSRDRGILAMAQSQDTPSGDLFLQPA